MRFLTSMLLILSSTLIQADTMDHYMNITNQIPQMEMKADPQSQAWARSARTIMAIANESIAETLVQANESAKSHGAPLFCLPGGVALNAETIQGVIVKTYRSISSQQSDKDKMTVSQIALLGMTRDYPCQNQALTPGFNQAQTQTQMQHVNGL